MEKEMPGVQAGFRKSQEAQVIIADACWIIKKTKEYQINAMCFIDYRKAFVCRSCQAVEYV